MSDDGPNMDNDCLTTEKVQTMIASALEEKLSAYSTLTHVDDIVANAVDPLATTKQLDDMADALTAKFKTMLDSVFSGFVDTISTHTKTNRDAFEARHSQQDKRLTALNDRVENHEHRIEHLDTLPDELSKMTGVLTRLETRLDTALNRVNDHDDEISALQVNDAENRNASKMAFDKLVIALHGDGTATTPGLIKIVDDMSAKLTQVYTFMVNRRWFERLFINRTTLKVGGLLLGGSILGISAERILQIIF